MPQVDYVEVDWTVLTVKSSNNLGMSKVIIRTLEDLKSIEVLEGSDGTYQADLHFEGYPEDCSISDLTPKQASKIQEGVIIYLRECDAS